MSSGVASAADELLDPSAGSASEPNEVRPGAAPTGLVSAGPTASEPVPRARQTATGMAEPIPREAIASVGPLGDPSSGAAAGVESAESVSDATQASEPERSNAHNNDTRIRDVGEPNADATPDAGSDEADQRTASSETSYTYWDGDVEITVWLVPQTVTRDAGPDGEAQGLAEAKAASKSGSSAVGDSGSVRRTPLDAPPGALLFRSESGTQMWLPGGVVLVLDPAWTTTQTDAFFARNDIEAGRVTEFDWLDNGFLIETEPGLASLELANRLVGQQGVELSSPNWATQGELK